MRSLLSLIFLLILYANNLYALNAPSDRCIIIPIQNSGKFCVKTNELKPQPAKKSVKVLENISMQEAKFCPAYGNVCLIGFVCYCSEKQLNKWISTLNY